MFVPCTHLTFSFFESLWARLGIFITLIELFFTSLRHLRAVQLLAAWTIVLLFYWRLVHASKFLFQMNQLALIMLSFIVPFSSGRNFFLLICFAWDVGYQSVCVRRPGFILCTGGTTYGQLPTHSNMSTPPRYCFHIYFYCFAVQESNESSSWIYSSLINANFLRNISSWMPSRRTSTVQTSTNQVWKVRTQFTTHVCCWSHGLLRLGHHCSNVWCWHYMASPIWPGFHPSRRDNLNIVVDWKFLELHLVYVIVLDLLEK